MKASTKAMIASVLTAPMMVASLAPAVSAQSAWFTLKNYSGYTLTRFYASPQSSSSWEQDILGLDVLPSGRASRITINDGRRSCYYDFKMVFSDGTSLTRNNINICTLGSYTIS